MNRSLPTVALLVLASASASSAGAQIAVPPYWMLTQGVASTCSDDDVTLPAVFVNVPAPLFASERGVLSAPGFANLGATLDSNFQGVGMFNFTVFTEPFALAADTPLTLTVRTFDQPNYQGDTVYLSSVTWNCTTGAILSIYAGSPLIFEDGFECGSICRWTTAAPLGARCAETGTEPAPSSPASGFDEASTRPVGD